MIITKKQKQTLEFIRDFLHEYKINPTHLEVAVGLGYSARQCATEIIDTLCERGYLEKTFFARRNIFITSEGRRLLNKLNREEVKKK